MSWLVQYATAKMECGEEPHYQFPRRFTWLQSDFSANKWRISDPTNEKNPTRESVNFDGFLDVDTSLSDDESMIEDLKRFLCVVLEGSKLGLFQYSVSSTSGARKIVDSFKRILTDICALTNGGSVSQLKQYHVEQLLEELVFSARYRHKYRERIYRYLQKNIESLPRLSGNPSKLKRTEIYRLAGVDFWAIRRDKVVLHWLQKIDSSLAREEEPTRPEFIEDEPSYVHPNQYRDVLKTIALFEECSDLFPALFENKIQFKVLQHPVQTYIGIAKVPNNSGNTKNIPPQVFLHFMDAATRYVLDYSEPLFELEVNANKFYQSALSLYQERGIKVPKYQAGKDTNQWIKSQNGISGAHAPFPIQAYKQSQRMSALSNEYSLSLRNALYGFLPISCLMIIFALTARRESEVYGLEAGCYREDKYGPSVCFYVKKTKRTSQWFPTVPLVVRAIKILERLSHTARQETGSSSLMIYKDPRRAGAVSSWRCILSSPLTDQFFDYIKLPRSDLDNWRRLSEHQFRRFFAIMYFYKYDASSSVESLMRELGHTDWLMTKTYLTELGAGKIFRQIEEDKIVEVGLETLSNNSLGGAMAEEFRSRLSASLVVVKDAQRKVVLEYVRERDYVIEFVPDGLCFGYSKGRESKSNCFDSGTVMCHRASASVCKSCPNLLSVPDIRQNFFPEALISPQCEESLILHAAKINNPETQARDDHAP